MSLSLLIGNRTPEELREKLIEKMKLVLGSGSDEECAICLESLNLPVITHCAHVFCKPCICEVIQREKVRITFGQLLYIFKVKALFLGE